MDINELENKRIYLALIFFIPLLWMNAFSPNAFAQNNTESDLKELQAMCYLQGYSPAPLLKNVTIYDKKKAFPGYNLFLSAHAPEAVLMDMYGTTIHRWHFSLRSLPDHAGHHAPFWTRARILKNGDLLALAPLDGLLKIDKKSRLIWFRRIFCHHDFDIDSNGNIYTLTLKDSRSGDNTGIKIDLITILSPQGRIKKEISIYDLFKKYPDPAYLNEINKLGRMKDFFYTNNGSKINLFFPWETILHSNSIQVLDGKWASRIPAFKKGNLLISIRNLGLIICVDPDKEEIVWLMDTVFWDQGQHFAKLLDNGNILLFDNYYSHNLSRVVEFDPATKQIVWDYSGQNGRFFSAGLSQCFRLPNGNTLITESTNGHSFEVTPQRKIVWEFYNPNQIYIIYNVKLNGSIRLIQRIPPDKRHGLIAVTEQMERIPIDSNLDWLKN